MKPEAFFAAGAFFGLVAFVASAQYHPNLYITSAFLIASIQNLAIGLAIKK